MEFPPESGPKRRRENICASSYPAPIPRNSAPIALRFRRLSPKLAPGKRPQIQPTRVTFSRISSLMNHRKHERRGLSIFCRWKRPGWHIFADNEKCFGFFTVGLPPAPHPPPLQAKKSNSTFFFEKSICASASALGISNRRTFEKHDKFQMYHKTTILCIETYAAVNEIKFWDCYYIYQNLSLLSFGLIFSFLLQLLVIAGEKEKPM